MRILTKISCAGPNYESIRTLSYSFISTSDPTWPEHQRIYSSLRVFAFMRESRGGIGGPDLLEITMLRTKEKELFSNSRAWTPHPGKSSWIRAWLCTRFNSLYIKGLWASSARMRPLTCHLSHHFAYMKCHSLAYKRLSCCWVGKGATQCNV